MKKIHLFFWVLSLFVNLVVAQNKEVQPSKFDSIYFETAVKWAKTDYVKALAISDSLFIHSTPPLHQLKALMLTASIYEQLGQQEESIKYALKAETIASKINDYDWQAKIAGFLSTQYRNLGLPQSGKQALNKGIQIIQNVENQKKRNFYYGLVNQELAYYEINNQNFEQAKEFIEKSATYFNRLKESPNNFYYKATNEELFAKCDIKLGNFDDADTHLDQSLNYLDQSSLAESVLRGLILNGKGLIAKHRKEYPLALDYLKQAEVLALSSGFLGLKLDVFKDLSEYYSEVGNVPKQLEYSHKFDSLYHTNTQRSQSTLDGIFSKIDQNNQQLESRQYFYVLAIGVLLLLILSSLVFYRIKKQKDQQRFKRIVYQLKQAKKEPEKPILVNDQIAGNSEDVVKEKFSISAAVEKKILIKLDEFEKGIGYLDKNISASALATTLDSNTKYLSLILKNHRNMDFNNYIGRLRIQYIMERMMNQPEYKNYKISYLAEECGFSTHSKFTAVFKKNTGITPSVFLENLSNQEQDAQ